MGKESQKEKETDSCKLCKEELEVTEKPLIHLNPLVGRDLDIAF